MSTPPRHDGSAPWYLLITWLGLLAAGWALPAEPPRLSESELQGKLRLLQETAGDADRLRHARDLASARRLSSQQVKAIARTLGPEDLRIEFALAAYPFTVDPENFYEVYDVFESYSKVFRLHDQIVRLRAQPPPGPVVVSGPPPLGDEDLAEILRTIRRESFDDGKLTIGRQIVLGAKGRIASRQVRDILKLFAFDDGRLKLAKAAYDCVQDPWNYHLVNDAFSFASNRQALSEYIQSRSAPRR